jgi:hypothetical protein
VVDAVPEEIETSGKVGSVSANRYAEIVAELRKLVETVSRIQFTIGDYALEVEPMREHGGSAPADELFTVKDSLFRLSKDIGQSYSTVKTARWTASRWPEDRRAQGVSFTVHNILAGIVDDEERRRRTHDHPRERRTSEGDAGLDRDRGGHGQGRRPRRAGPPAAR